MRVVVVVVYSEPRSNKYDLDNRALVGRSYSVLRRLASGHMSEFQLSWRARVMAGNEPQVAVLGSKNMLE